MTMGSEEAATATGEQFVPNQLAALVPSFDPSKDSLEIWSQKVELLVNTWPPSKLSELATRLILNCSGSAFQKLQLHKDELIKNDPKAIKALVAYLGGQWGKVPLEKRFDAAEKALFRCAQRPDETNDSYLARADVLWSELLSKNMALSELRAYVVLRGSQLPAEDKKRVLVESGAENDAQLTLDRVSKAVRMLGAGFFQEYAGLRKQKLKTYDHQVLVAEDEETETGTFHAEEEGPDETSYIEQLASEGDPDAVLISEYESAMTETIQDDEELASCYNAYAEARYRLSERFRSRGFWPIKGKGKSGKSKSKGKFAKDRKSLQERILSSFCRKCGQKGHWKSECPNSAGSYSSDGRSSSSHAPTAAASYVDMPMNSLPLEFMQLPTHQEESLDASCSHPVQDIFVGISNANITYGEDMGSRYGDSYLLRNRKSHDEVQSCQQAISILQNRHHKSFGKNPLLSSHAPESCLRQLNPSERAQFHTDRFDPDRSLPSVEEAHFASHGSYGVVDLGASKTVIGSDSLKELMKSLPPEILQHCYRTPCVIHFRFGNQGILSSEWAFVLPISKTLHLKVAVVKGSTPFLLSNALLRTIGAVIDTSRDVLWCHRFNCAVSLHLTNRGLFLLDLKELLQKAWHHGETGIGVSKDDRSHVRMSEPVQKKLFECAEPSKHQAPETCHFLDDSQNIKPGYSHELKCVNKGTIETVVGPSDSSTKESPNPQILPQEQSSDPSFHPSVICNVAGRPPSQSSDSSGTPTDSRHATGRHGGIAPGVRPETCGQKVPGHLGHRPGVDHLGHIPLREEHKEGTSDFHDVCREESGRTRETRWHSGENGHRSSADTSSSNIDQAQGDDAPSQDQRCFINSTADSRDGRRGLRPDRISGVCGGPSSSNGTSSRCGHIAAKDASYGECSHADHEPPSDPTVRAEGSECFHLTAGDVDQEFDSPTQHFGNRLTERKRYLQLVLKYSKELEECEKHVTRGQKKINALEVYSGPQSQLTQQVNNVGLKGERFGYQQGDLKTQAGRYLLFTKIIEGQPEDVWYSPECRPWSAWSFFNSSQSLEAWDRIHQERLEGLEQVALGTVIFRYQCKRHHHFHWEQPDRSLMFRLPMMQEVFAYTKMIECDLCEVGDLKDPETQLPIKKSLLICTTSQRMYDMFHGRKCRHQHHHQPIEGSVKWKGERIARSRFTENYPRKFARQIALLWKHPRVPREKPFSDFALVTTRGDDAESPPSKRQRIRAAPPKAPHLIDISEMPCVKRRKLEKQPDQTSQHSEIVQQVFTDICRKVDEKTPRVGKRRFDSTDEIIQDLQKWFPEKQIKCAITCRGTDRLQGPPANLNSSEAPWRKTIFVHRTTGKILITRDWEEWGVLPKRQLIRTGCPARLSITVFAHNPVATPQPEVPTVAPGPLPGDLIETPQNVPERVVCDVSSHHHGPRFQNLSAQEREVLLRCHRNLGHPSADRLKTLLKQQGFRPEAIEAIDDLRCSTCLEQQAPKISRPSALKEPLDFNDKVSMDGVSWENKKGTVFHFYHVIDYSTSFHIAAIAPNRSTPSAVEFLGNHWISWAGPPIELLVDSATELNSHEMDHFCQRFNIRKSTTCPEAHWQNGRAERHGEVLQQMLNKYQDDFEINNYHDLQQALWHCVHAKNACSLRRGFAPEVLVLGKHTRLPGSLSGDSQVSSHLLAESESQQGLLFRENLARREAARKAFWEADNHAAIRRAMLRRTRPNRGTYQAGEWVMMWKKVEPSKGQWIGPARVVTQEGTHTVWSTMSGRLYRCSPEQIRPVSAFEARQVPVETTSNPQSLLDQIKEVQAQNNTEQFQDLSGQAFPVPPGVSTPVEVIPNPTDTPEEESSQSLEEQGSEHQPDAEPNIPSSEVSINNPDPTDVPVPEDTDSELVTQALYCQDQDVVSEPLTGVELAWRFEIAVGHQELINFQEGEDSADAFLVSSVKKQRVEVKLHELSREEQQEMKIAKDTEIKNWISTNTVERLLRDKIDPSQIMKCRWILTWKPLDEEARKEAADPSKTRKAKARLVVLGFMDPNLDKLQRDSPTMSRLSRMMVLQLIASKAWTLFSFDIRTAFLQGQPQKDRLLAIEPVPELSQALKLKSNEICKLTKSAYGLVDAPFLWYQALRKKLLEIGFEESPFDPCVYLLRDPKTGLPEGILGTHVDDGLGGGNSRFDAKIAELEATFPFGSRRTGKFTFTGIDLQQHADKSITMSQSAYIKNIAPIAITQDRRQKIDEVVTESERQGLRALIGSIQYASVNTRPDLSSRLSFLQSSITKAKVSDLIEGNRVLHEAKKDHDLSITIRPIPCSDLRFLVFSDASFSSQKVPDSHAGCIILATHKEIANNCKCPISPLSWGSKKIQRVVVSTLAAETMAMSSALDQLSWLKLCWGWMQDPCCNWKKPEEALKELPQSYASATYRAQQLPESLAVTDCKSLFDLVTRAAPPNCQEFRTMLHARSIKELLSEGISMRWVHSGAQLADSLTKVMETSFLKETLRQGTYKLHDELEVLKARSNSRNRLKWLRGEGCSDSCMLQHY